MIAHRSLIRSKYIGEGAFDTGKPILWDFGEISWVDDPVQSGEDLFSIYPEAMGIRSLDRLSLSPTTLSLTEKALAQFPWKESVRALSIHPELQRLESLTGFVNLQDIEISENYRLSKVPSSLSADCLKLKIPAFIPSIEIEGVFHTAPTEEKSIQSALVLYGAQTLSAETFQNCKNLTKVQLPSSLELIEKDAFAGCPLEWISYKNKTNNLLIGQTGFVDVNYEGELAENADLSNLVVLKGTRQINSAAFKNCSALSSVSILGDLQSIGSRAFYGCSSLTSIILPEPLQSIGEDTFFKCSSLASIILPDSLQSIGDSAFYNCSSLASIILPDSLQSIESLAFSWCSSLESIILSDSVQSIGNSAFYNCSSLASIVLPESLRSIDQGAFYGCSSLVEVDVSKITLEATNSISWTSVFYNSEDRTRVTKVICRQEQADTMKSVFTNATLVYVD